MKPLRNGSFLTSSRGTRFWKSPHLKPLFGNNEVEEKLVKELALLKKYMDTGSLAKRITSAIKSCNLLFVSLTNVPIFREDIQVISLLHQPCNDENDLNLKLGGIAELFQVNPEEWKPLIKGFEPWMKRGNTLLLKWLDEQKVPYDHEKVRVWDVIIEWRNASSPYHPTNKKLIGLVNFFGRGFPINCVELNETILKMFLESLEMLQRVLNDAYLQRKD